MKLLTSITILGIAVLAGLAFGQPITVINLKYRSADEIIPVIQPFMQSGDALSGDGYRLFVRTDPNTLKTVKGFISTLDKAPAQLLISLKNAGEISNTDDSISLQGNIGTQQARIRLNDGKENNIRLEAETNRSTSTSRQAPGVRATEGEPALIYTGVNVPVNISEKQRNGNRIVERELVEYRNIQSGLYVTARLNGDNVTLTIKPQSQSLGENNAINQFSLQTTVTGKLGEWISLGSVSQSSARYSQNTASRTTTQTLDRNTVMIKVERLDDAQL